MTKYTYTCLAGLVLVGSPRPLLPWTRSRRCTEQAPAKTRLIGSSPTRDRIKPTATRYDSQGPSTRAADDCKVARPWARTAASMPQPRLWPDAGRAAKPGKEGVVFSFLLSTLLRSTLLSVDVSHLREPPAGMIIPPPPTVRSTSSSARSDFAQHPKYPARLAVLFVPVHARPPDEPPTQYDTKSASLATPLAALSHHTCKQPMPQILAKAHGHHSIG